MKCKKCNISVFKRPLQRVNPIGEDGIWWCEPCLEEHEPELYNNTMEDKNDVEKDLIDMFYPRKK